MGRLLSAKQSRENRRRTVRTGEGQPGMSDGMEEGRVHPGLKWGPFVFRVPFVHTRIEWPEFAQGIFVAGATGLGLVPYLTGQYGPNFDPAHGFGLSFEQAIALIFIHSVLLSMSPIVFGVPMAPGWVTPALPLVIGFLWTSTALPDGATAEQIQITYDTRFQLMSVMAINFAILVLFMGFTGLGKKFVQWIPPALKAGIIMGAAIAALKRVFLDDAERFLFLQPWTTITAVSVCLLLTFSVPIQHLRAKYRWLNIFCSLGLLPGFLIAAILGPLVGEVTYNVTFDKIIVIPPFVEAIQAVSPLFIGFDHITLDMYLQSIVVVLMAYVIFFGDVVTGIEILKDGQAQRKDEDVNVDASHVHISAGIRNVLMGLFAPFFPTQGILWTGVQVIIVQRWRTGRENMQSMFSGIASYYVFGVPLLYFVVPLLLLLKPLMGVALSLTLVLTGFACAYVAMAIPRTQIERGVVILMGVSLAVFDEPYIGMLIGIAATFLLVGPKGLQAGDEPL